MAFGTVSGTFQGNNASIPASFAAALSTGSGVVKIGDIVVCLVTEQTALTVTSVTDSQANTYTAQNAGTLSGANVSGRLFWTRITTAGTLTSVTATCTSSANDGVIIAAIINGPFLASPVDVNLANASDIVSPFTAPPTGTMAQTTEVVVSWGASTGNIVWVASAPTVIAIQQASATVVEGILGTQVPPSTATVTPTYTGTAPTADVLGTISFKGDIAAMDAGSPYPLWSLPVRTRPVHKATISSWTAVIAPYLGWFQPLSLPVRRIIQQARRADDGQFNSPFTPPATVALDWFQPLSEPVRRVAQTSRLSDDGVFATIENFPSCGLVGIDNAGTALVGGSPVNTVDYTRVTVGGGSNRALVAMMTTDTLTAGMTAVWDQGGTNQSMTLIGTSNFFGQTIGIFGLRNPTSGNNTLRFSWTTAGIPTVTAVSLITVDQSSDAFAFSNYQSNSGNVSSLSVTVPSKLGDLVIGIGGVAGATVLAVGDNNLYIDNTSVGSHSGAGWSAGTPSEIFTGNSSTSGNWLLSAINVAAFPCPIDTDFILPFTDPIRRVRGMSGLADDGLFAAPFVPTATVDIGWFNPLSEPVRVRTSPANQQVLAFAPNPIVPNGWAAPLSEPARAKQRAIADYAYAPLAVSEVVTIDKWFNPLADPSRTRRLNISDQSYVPFVEEVTVNKWLSPWTDPTRKSSLATAQRQAFTGSALPLVSFSWFNNLSEPTRLRRSIAPDQPFVAVTTEVVTVDKWFIPLSEPTRPRGPNAALQQAYTTGYFPDAVNASALIGWFNPLSDPARTNRRLILTPNQSAVPLTTETITVDKWFVALSEPARAKRFSAPDQSLVPLVTTEVITVDKWFVALSEPVRTKPALLAALQSTATEDTKLLPDPANFLWFAPLSEPVRQPIGLKAAQQPYFYYQPLQITPSFGWFNNLSEPTRLAARATRYEQQSWSLFVEPTFVSFGWFNALVDPTRRPTRPIPDEYPGFPPIVPFGWFGNLSDPVRIPVGLKASLQPYFYYQPFPIALSFGWFNNLSDPTRRKVDVGYLQDYADWIAISVTIDWFGPFSDPIRVKPTPTRAEQPWTPFQPVVVTVDIGWFNNLSEPSRRVPRATPSDQYAGFTPSVSFGWFVELTTPVKTKPRTVWLDEQSFQFPFVSFSWYAPLTNPMLPKKRVLDPPSFSFAPNPIIPSYGWYGSLSIPVRIKPKVWEGHYTFAPNPIIPSYGWFGSLSLPVRTKPKVWEGIYEARPSTALAFVYLATMAATEDQDFFLGVLYAFNPPLRAYVDIIQNDPRHRGNVGVIAPTPQSSTIASIVTPQTVPSTGVPVAAVGARVAIITSR